MLHFTPAAARKRDHAPACAAHHLPGGAVSMQLGSDTDARDDTVGGATGHHSGNQTLRGWQRRALVKYLAGTPRDFLAVATPGSGKTTFALRVAAELLGQRAVEQITVVVPTEHLKVQWAQAAERHGLALDPKFSNSNPQTSPEYHGVMVTYSQVAAHPTLHRVRTEQRKTLVIFDEIHHGGDAKTWGDAIREAFSDGTRRIALTGTPFRSDDSPIPFVTYAGGADGVLRSQADHTYGYAEALADGVVRPVVFLAYSGQARWRDSAGEEHAARLGEPLSAEQTARAWRTALAPAGGWVRGAWCPKASTYLGWRSGSTPQAPRHRCFSHRPSAALCDLAGRVKSQAFSCRRCLTCCSWPASWKPSATTCSANRIANRTKIPSTVIPPRGRKPNAAMPTRALPHWEPTPNWIRSSLMDPRSAPPPPPEARRRLTTSVSPDYLTPTRCVPCCTAARTSSCRSGSPQAKPHRRYRRVRHRWRRRMAKFASYVANSTPSSRRPTTEPANHTAGSTANSAVGAEAHRLPPRPATSFKRVSKPCGS